MTKQHTSPCTDCPFRKTVEPGALGGSSTVTYVGQIASSIPFVIPCHSCIDYDDPDWKAKASVPGGVSSCAGAAIFRSNIGKVKPALLTLPKDTETVFSSYEEFVSHHEGLDLPDGSIPQAKIDDCVRHELERAGVVVSLVPKVQP